MKQSTVDTLKRFTDVEQIGDGALRDAIHLTEKFCERCGNADVPWGMLVALCVQNKFDVDISGAAPDPFLDDENDPGDVGADPQPSNDALMKKREAMAHARAAKLEKRKDEAVTP